MIVLKRNKVAVEFIICLDSNLLFKIIYKMKGYNMCYFVNGDKSRIFLNTAIGCACKCAYCYLDGVGIKGIPIKGDVDKIVEQLLMKDYFKQGPDGTILSIGCYSECWDEENKENTINLLKKIVVYGNYIQLATKKSMTMEEVVTINEIVTFKNQIGIYISAPTISKSREIEVGTDTIEARLSVLEYSKMFNNIYFVLYIKPVLFGITVCDIEKYIEIIKKFSVNCVVGSMLILTNRADKDKMIGSSYFKEKQNEEEQIIIDKLRKVKKVYTHSCDVIEEMRKN